MIDLSIGSPDQPPPAKVIQYLSEAVTKEGAFRYTLTGIKQFNEAVARFYTLRYGVSVQPEDVLQLMGSQDGLSHLALAFLEADDIVLVPDPGYPIYAASVQIAGAQVVTMPLLEENGYKPDFSAIPKQVLNKAKMMILNYPGNPLATRVEASFFEQVIALGMRYGILIVHDFAYSELIYDGHKPLSILSIPDAWETALEFNSFSKSFNLAGARIGYVIGKPALLEPLATLKSHIDYGVFLPIQQAAIMALEEPESFLSQHTATYQLRRDTFISALYDIGWEVKPPEGSMFLWAPIPHGQSSSEFAYKAMTHGVVVTPGEAFGDYGQGYVRIALVEGEARLREAALRFKHLLS
jgi:aspartate/methionine/tyrosine aminotransferase